MASAIPSFVTLGLFVLALLLLAALSRQISLKVQSLLIYLSHSQDMAVVGLFILLMPGIYVHEGAHWLMARLLRLRAGKFRVWPQRKGNMIGMGQVTVEQKDRWRDSLVGMAPLLVGSLLITLIGRHIFRTDSMTAALAAGDLAAAMSALRTGLSAADSALWAYLLFAVANAMMPSASDREPLRPVLIYVAAGVALYVVLGMPLAPLAAVIDQVQPALEEYVGALLFAIVLDLAVLALLQFALLLIEPRRTAG